MFYTQYTCFVSAVDFDMKEDCFTICTFSSLYIQHLAMVFSTCAKSTVVSYSQ
jgi:hypothetical protein